MARQGNASHKLDSIGVMMDQFSALLEEAKALLGVTPSQAIDTPEQKAGAAARAGQGQKPRPGGQPGQMPKPGQPPQQQGALQAPGGGKGPQSPLMGQGSSGAPGSPAQEPPKPPGNPIDPLSNAPGTPNLSSTSAGPGGGDPFGTVGGQQFGGVTQGSQQAGGSSNSILSMLNMLKSGGSLAKKLYDTIPGSEQKAQDYSDQKASSTQEEPQTSSSLTSSSFLPDPAIARMSKEIEDITGRKDLTENIQLDTFDQPSLIEPPQSSMQSLLSPSEALKQGSDLAKSPGASLSQLSPEYSEKLLSDANSFMSSGAHAAEGTAASAAGSALPSGFGAGEEAMGGMAGMASAAPNLGLGAGAAEEAVGSLAPTAGAGINMLGAAGAGLGALGSIYGGLSGSMDPGQAIQGGLMSGVGGSIAAFAPQAMGAMGPLAIPGMIGALSMLLQGSHDRPKNPDQQSEAWGVTERDTLTNEGGLQGAISEANSGDRNALSYQAQLSQLKNLMDKGPQTYQEYLNLQNINANMPGWQNMPGWDQVNWQDPYGSGGMSPEQLALSQRWAPNYGLDDSQGGN